MEDAISPAQVRGARAMLGWSLVTLATTALISVSAVKRIEDGMMLQTSSAALSAVQDALENKGIRFLPDDGDGMGVRLKSN